MKIYTKRGDTGMTDLFGGGRVKKCHLRVKTYGEIDAANSVIGLAHSAPYLSDGCKEQLVRIMKLLFCAGAEIATAPKESAQAILERELKNRISEHHIVALEQGIDEMESHLTPLKSFILPAGSDACARLHYARTAVRRAEVALLELVESGEAVRPDIIKFFNRLSDFLFVMARLANAEACVNEIAWNGQITE